MNETRTKASLLGEEWRPYPHEDKWKVVRLHMEVEIAGDKDKFLWEVRELGRFLGLDGLVHPEENELVIIVAEGPQYILEDFLARTKAIANGNWTNEVEVWWGPANNQYKGFEVRY